MIFLTIFASAVKPEIASHIYEVTGVVQIPFENLTERKTYIFDIDKTLVKPLYCSMPCFPKGAPVSPVTLTSSLIHMGIESLLHPIRQCNIASELGLWNLGYSRCVMHEWTQLIDAKIPVIFRTLKEKDNKVWTFTNVKTGIIAGTNKTFEEFIYKKLAWHEIFCSPFNDDQAALNFRPFEGANMQGYNGILLNGKGRPGHFGEKAPIFAEMINQGLLSQEQKNAGIVYADDRHDHVIGMKEVCKEKDIPFDGFHITGYASNRIKAKQS